MPAQNPPRFRPSDRVRVLTRASPGHVRTPTYIKGRVGVIERLHGSFPNPEGLAYGGDGLPGQALYAVRFQQSALWAHYPVAADTLLVDVYDHWLEPAADSRGRKET